MSGYVVGLDLGTTSTKAVALSADGQILGLQAAPNRMWSEQPGSAFQDPREVWAGAQQALAGLAGQVNPREALGICLSGAMHSLFPLGADGEPLANAVTWADVRAGEQAARLRQGCDAHGLYLRTGCPLQYLYHPAKLRRWLDELHEAPPGGFGAIKDYIYRQLCGRWATDHSLASATGLMDTQRQVWDGEALALGGVRAGQLPELLSPLDAGGRLARGVGLVSGFPEGLAVVIGAGDGGLANLGSGAVRPGESVITVGTSGAVRRIAERPVLDESERTWCYLLFAGRWFHGGASNNAGLAVQWVRERFYRELPGSAGYAALFRDAASVPAGAEGVVIAPYFSGERNPHWDPNARAVIHGLALEHDRRQVARAVLEGSALCLADIWEALGPGQEPVRLTGMINQQPVWAQILCDVLQVQLAGLEAADSSAVGAAMLGHYALGSAASLEAIAATAQAAGHYEPEPGRREVYRAVQKVFRGLYRR